MIPLIIAIPCWAIVIVLITYYGAVKIVESQVDLIGFRKEYVYTFPLLMLGVCAILLATFISFISVIQWLGEIAK